MGKDPKAIAVGEKDVWEKTVFFHCTRATVGFVTVCINHWMHLFQLLRQGTSPTVEMVPTAPHKEGSHTTGPGFQIS